MTTWLASGPISHPWFTKPISKRKLSASDDSPTSGRSRSSSPSPPSPKRRKHTILEAGFSSLSLSSPESSISGGWAHVSESSVLGYMPMEDDDCLAPVVVLPSTVEEPDIPEVKMKSSSWYEPEPDRIVVTSLESSDDEDEEEPDADTTSISISPVLLKKIANQSTRDLETPLITPPTNTSQALVLYKPLPVPGIVCEENRRDENEKTDDIVEDDDAMEVEL
ncbi:hypothetical protein C0995_000611 [Termitomyces sp. Mi166|nr:hypothetical protein C0995_000611 [Termitomyces sp. Mi166\